MKIMTLSAESLRESMSPRDYFRETGCFTDTKDALDQVLRGVRGLTSMAEAFERETHQEAWRRGDAEQHVSALVVESQRVYTVARLLQRSVRATPLHYGTTLQEGAREG